MLTAKSKGIKNNYYNFYLLPIDAILDVIIVLAINMSTSLTSDYFNNTLNSLSKNFGIKAIIYIIIIRSFSKEFNLLVLTDLFLKKIFNFVIV